MSDVYQRLAARLDEFPNGYPATENGVELEILRHIFSEDEAETALLLRPMPETAEEVAARLDLPAEAMRNRLDAMAGKGQIGCFKLAGRQVYLQVPFLLGIYEFQLNRLDETLAGLFKAYRPSLMKTLGGTKPALARVVPVNASIEGSHQVLRYEDMRGIIEEARSFVVRDCICRRQQALEGNPCRHTVETCLGFSNEEGAFDYFTYAGRIITKEEALKLLETTVEEGLVHCTYNVEEGHRFVCNCCICCCELLKGLKSREAPYTVAGSNFQAVIDQDDCIACGTCAEKRCPMDAIIEEHGAYRVLPERCIGCGVCTVTCPSESITLERRPEAEQDRPPAGVIELNMKRAANRNKHEVPPP